MKNLFFAFVLLLTAVSCTDQSMAKSFGGKMALNIPEQYVLVNMTFKESNLWILARSKSNPCDWIFYEESSWDVMEGRISITSCDTVPMTPQTFEYQ